MSNNQTVQKSGSRGMKMVTSTGVDNSSMGSTGTDSLKGKGIGGGRDNLGHSVAGGKVASAPKK